MPGTLFVVATPIGNLDDITARALRVLRDVALIAAEDTRRTAHLLARYGITTPSTSLHEHNESKKTPALVARLTRGDDIALVSDAGTPVISDPGQHLVRASIDAGIRVEPIPGPSAIMAALAASGLPSKTFTFLGFPPTRSSARTEWLERLRTVGGTVVFFEAPHRLRETLGSVLAAAGDRPAVVCREMTKMHEELVRGPISAVLAQLAEVRGELTVILDIGHTTNLIGSRSLSDAQMITELGEITKYERLSKRRAINALARRYGRPPNEIYAAVERAKKSGL